MIYIDTGAFIAKYLAKDQGHETAIEKWNQIHSSNEICVTSNFVLDETFTLLGRWAGYAFAAEKATFIYASNRFTILRPDQTDELAAIVLLEKYADQNISFTDCISFCLMKNKRIKRAFTFDKHFKYAGFEPF